MTKLTLWIDPKEYYILRTSLEDEFGNRTVLKFFNIEIDKGIDDTLFQFTPPPGVEIFEPPQF
jgi:outer membrane lipoprotein carrier protein